MKVFCVAALVLALCVVGTESQINRQWDEGPCDPPEMCWAHPQAECRLICWDNPDTPGGKECMYQHFLSKERVDCFPHK